MEIREIMRTRGEGRRPKYVPVAGSSENLCSSRRSTPCHITNYHVTNTPPRVPAYTHTPFACTRTYLTVLRHNPPKFIATKHDTPTKTRLQRCSWKWRAYPIMRIVWDPACNVLYCLHIPLWKRKYFSNLSLIPSLFCTKGEIRSSM